MYFAPFLPYKTTSINTSAFLDNASKNNIQILSSFDKTHLTKLGLY